jgi:hypothetical protein
MKTANLRKEQGAPADAESDAQGKPNLSKRTFDPQVYMRIGDDQLITLSLKLVIEDDKPPSFENVVEEAYNSFPERFSFQGHPEWPHTLVIDRSIRRCATDRQKRWISGKAATGYKLLPAGETVAQDTYEKLRGEKPLGKSSVKAARPTQSLRVVKHVEGSPAFEKYKLRGDVGTVTEYDLCDLLYCTIESTPETLENNLAVLVSNIRDVQRDDLLPFLDALRERFRNRFE